MSFNRIFLIGLSGSGKSTVGQRIAERLGWEFVDTDRFIETQTGRSIAEIFESQGETAFRRLEADALRQCCDREEVVVATGGGAPTTPEGRTAIAGGFVAWLSVSPDVAAERLAAQPGSEERPLLAGGLEERLAVLLAERQPLYELADAAVHVDRMSPGQVADEIVQLWEEARRHPQPAADRFDRHGRAPSAQPEADQSEGEVEGIAAVVRTPSVTYPVVVHNGALQDLGRVCRRQMLRGRAFLVSDERVGPRYAETVAASLETAGYPVASFLIPSGEEHKTLLTVSRVYDWLIEQRAERSDFVVCLGGGVVTDLGGFAAATYLRGVAFVHVPTTLLGMVDAAIGGKTGVDHPKGKNLIGAFAQPSAVVVDPDVLASLPDRELRSGWAEVVKHGLILDADLFAELEEVAADPRAMVSPMLIGRSAAIKAEVVSADERESDRRTLLNYGHTIGHAIEAVTGYEAYLHGEAISVGMHAAGLISVELGLLAPEDLDRQQALFRACGLPERARDVPAEAVIEATLLDKKVSGGRVRWVLLDGIGHAVTRADVPEPIVRRVASAVLG